MCSMLMFYSKLRTFLRSVFTDKNAVEMITKFVYSTKSLTMTDFHKKSACFLHCSDRQQLDRQPNVKGADGKGWDWISENFLGMRWDGIHNLVPSSSTGLNNEKKSNINNYLDILALKRFFSQKIENYCLN